MPVFRPKRLKNPTRWGGTYLYGFCKVVPSGLLAKEMSACGRHQGTAQWPHHTREKKSLVPRVCRESAAKKKKERKKLRNKTNKRTSREKKLKNQRQDMNPWLPQNLKGALCNELYHRCLLRAGPFTWSICDCCVGFNDVIVDYITADIW